MTKGNSTSTAKVNQQDNDFLFTFANAQITEYIFRCKQRTQQTQCIHVFNVTFHGENLGGLFIFFRLISLSVLLESSAHTAREAIEKRLACATGPVKDSCYYGTFPFSEHERTLQITAVTLACSARCLHSP